MLEVEIFFVDVDDIVDVVMKVLVDDFYNGEIIMVIGFEKLIFE